MQKEKPAHCNPYSGVYQFVRKIIDTNPMREKETTESGGHVKLKERPVEWFLGGLLLGHTSRSIAALP